MFFYYYYFPATFKRKKPTSCAVVSVIIWHEMIESGKCTQEHQVTTH